MRNMMVRMFDNGLAIEEEKINGKPGLSRVFNRDGETVYMLPLGPSSDGGKEIDAELTINTSITLGDWLALCDTVFDGDFVDENDTCSSDEKCARGMIAEGFGKAIGVLSFTRIYQKMVDTAPDDVPHGLVSVVALMAATEALIGEGKVKATRAAGAMLVLGASVFNEESPVYDTFKRLGLNRDTVLPGGLPGMTYWSGLKIEKGGCPRECDECSEADTCQSRAKHGDN